MILASCGGNSSDDGVPLIFAAASLSDVLTESAQVYERETGKRVDFSFGGSITLANQIVKLGAPADGVLFAGVEPARIITEAGLESDGSAPQLITSDLVVIAGRNSSPIDHLSDLASSSNDRIAIANPDLAPAGKYAMRVLEIAELTEAVAEQVVLTLDVRAALAAVESGNAKYGIVYSTDAIASDNVETVFEVEGAGVRYFFTGLAGAANGRAAQTFLNYVVLESATREIFAAAGFEVRRASMGPGDPGG